VGDRAAVLGIAVVALQRHPHVIAVMATALMKFPHSLLLISTTLLQLYKKASG
jgi:hypothetical protein